jgi:hypothetical protein
VWDKASRRRHLHLGHEGKAQVYDPNIWNKYHVIVRLITLIKVMTFQFVNTYWHNRIT